MLSSSLGVQLLQPGFRGMLCWPSIGFGYIVSSRVDAAQDGSPLMSDAVPSALELCIRKWVR